ncbi:MAG TPA: hypothetical protein VH518_05305 [Tepidisphaeraceae bacterium]|jgi:anti-sigma factor RsiW
MRSILEQLDSDQAMLLMYLAEELDQIDRVRVEQRLATEDALRAELEQLREAKESLHAGMSAVDAAQPLNGAGGALERKLSRLFKQWQADRARSAATTTPQSERRSFWWAYPVAAAILMVIAYTVWWGFQPPDPQMATTQDTAPSAPFANRFSGDGFPGRGFGPGYDPANYAVLADAERDLDDLAQLGTMTDDLRQRTQ